MQILIHRLVCLNLDPVHASPCHVHTYTYDVHSPDHCYSANTVRFSLSGLMLVLPLRL